MYSCSLIFSKGMCVHTYVLVSYPDVFTIVYSSFLVYKHICNGQNIRIQDYYIFIPVELALKSKNPAHLHICMYMGTYVDAYVDMQYAPYNVIPFS